ncbi:MAG: dUTP diphosphatase [Calditrichaeota bacterium]|nr:MAG: dUTP diphosphatase [Calditrichota bacterium]
MADNHCNCTVRIKRLHDRARMPEYAHLGDSGADLFAAESVTLQPMERRAVGTGLAAEVPRGVELQVRPKSGLALKSGLTVLNTPGTIDYGYRGEIRVILVNLSQAPYRVEEGQKIAQLVAAPVFYARFQETDVLSETSRGEGGFGSTGLNK